MIIILPKIIDHVVRSRSEETQSNYEAVIRYRYLFSVMVGYNEGRMVEFFLGFVRDQILPYVICFVLICKII